MTEWTPDSAVEKLLLDIVPDIEEYATDGFIHYGDVETAFLLALAQHIEAQAEMMRERDEALAQPQEERVKAWAASTVDDLEREVEALRAQLPVHGEPIESAEWTTMEVPDDIGIRLPDHAAELTEAQKLIVELEASLEATHDGHMQARRDLSEAIRKRDEARELAEHCHDWAVDEGIGCPHRLPWRPGDE